MMISAVSGALAPSPRAIAQQARDFESTAISQLLAPIFDTVQTPDPQFGGSEAEKTWQPFLLEAIARQMQADGGLGLVNQIETALQQKPIR